MKAILVIFFLFCFGLLACSQHSELSFDIRDYKLKQVDSLEDGIVKRYFLNSRDTSLTAVEIFIDGNLSREFLYRGKKEGPAYIFSARGDTLMISNYHNGLKHGLNTFFHSNGKIERNGQYRAGKRDGLWQTFDEGGNLLLEEKWEMGQKKE
jgi:antitoxin component YwqK of YwqJK toxin-antitoxin module